MKTEKKWLGKPHVTLMGVSAGASIASAVATSSDSAVFDADLDAMNAVKGPGNVNVVVSLFGLYNFTKLQAQSEWLVGASNAAFDGKYLPRIWKPGNSSWARNRPVSTCPRARSLR
jgi:hypothetical protein